MTTDPTLLLTGQQMLLNVDELARLLRLSKTSIYRLVERRQIPFHRLPRGLRFSKTDVENYLQQTRVDSVESNYGCKKDKNIVVG